MYCKECGALLDDGQRFCDKCGREVTREGNKQIVYVRSERNEGLAAVLSFLWAGVGQIYVNEIKRGLLIILAYSLLLVAGIVLMIAVNVFVGLVLCALGVVLWIWNIFDAHDLAKKYNERQRQ